MLFGICLIRLGSCFCEFDDFLIDLHQTFVWLLLIVDRCRVYLLVVARFAARFLLPP